MKTAEIGYRFVCPYCLQVSYLEHHLLSASTVRVLTGISLSGRFVYGEPTHHTFPSIQVWQCGRCGAVVARTEQEALHAILRSERAPATDPHLH